MKLGIDLIDYNVLQIWQVAWNYKIKLENMKNINELIFRVNNNLRNNRQVEKDDIKKLLAIAMKMEKQFAISSVSKSLRDKEQFIELAKMIEIHIQKSVDYQASIGTGYFTERFNEVYKKYLESNVC